MFTTFFVVIGRRGCVHVAKLVKWPALLPP